MSLFEASEVLLSEMHAVVGQWKDGPQGYLVKYVQRPDGTKDLSLSNSIASEADLDERYGDDWAFAGSHGEQIPDPQMAEQSGYEAIPTHDEGGPMFSAEDLVAQGNGWRGEQEKLDTEKRYDDASKRSPESIARTQARALDDDFQNDLESGDAYAVRSMSEQPDREGFDAEDERAWNMSLYSYRMSFVMSTDEDPSQILDDVIHFGGSLTDSYGGNFYEDTASVTEEGAPSSAVLRRRGREVSPSYRISFEVSINADPSEAFDALLNGASSLARDHYGEFDENSVSVDDIESRPMGVAELNAIILDEKRKVLAEQGALEVEPWIEQFQENDLK